MSVSNGQDANQTTFNNAFLSRTTDTSTIGKVELDHPDTTSIAEVQRELNAIASYTGNSVNQSATVKPSWTDNSVGASGDSLFSRIEALVLRFESAAGHDHTGVDGEGPIIDIDLATTGNLPGNRIGDGLVADQIVYGQAEQASAFVYKNGRLGVNTASPSATFDVNGTIAVRHQSINASADNEITGYTTSFIRLTAIAGQTLSRITAPTNGAPYVLIIANLTGADVTIEDGGANLGEDIATGTNDVTWQNGTLITVAYDPVNTKWRLLSGGGGGSGLGFLGQTLGVTTVTPDSGYSKIRYKSSFGSPTLISAFDLSNLGPADDGMIIEIWGTSDTNIVSLAYDTTGVGFQNGPWDGYNGSVIAYEYDGPNDHLREIYRNGI